MLEQSETPHRKAVTLQLLDSKQRKKVEKERSLKGKFVQPAWATSCPVAVPSPDVSLKFRGIGQINYNNNNNFYSCYLIL